MKSVAKKIKGLTYRQELDKKEADARRSREHPNGIINQAVQSSASRMSRSAVDNARSISRAARSRRRAAKKVLRTAADRKVVAK